MGKPTKEELELALEKASSMRELDEDPYYIAKSLLNLNFRVHLLEEILQHTELYLKTGNAAHEHSVLVKAIAQYKTADHRDPGDEDPTFGLG